MKNNLTIKDPVMDGPLTLLFVIGGKLLKFLRQVAVRPIIFASKSK